MDRDCLDSRATETAICHDYSQLARSNITSSCGGPKTQKSAGSSFVCLCKVRSLQNLVLQPISFQRLELIGKSTRLQERLQEEQKLRYLAEVTAVRYEQL